MAKEVETSNSIFSFSLTMVEGLYDGKGHGGESRLLVVGDGHENNRDCRWNI
ncbi:hypothetical protein Lalb_Chr01g0012671 [Lupinus albus]|uniref:Uncharacterized protein n=1 Tax=Lupinus albus TaxID=3870 RepID=A0A6A4R5T1_LUPAL|nr:hypothetical protein Lalb_Chr01g0012671 [Lupinus albus]